MMQKQGVEGWADVLAAVTLMPSVLVLPLLISVWISCRSWFDS